MVAEAEKIASAFDHPSLLIYQFLVTGRVARISASSFLRGSVVRTSELFPLPNHNETRAAQHSARQK
jgi:hypothetical protein